MTTVGIDFGSRRIGLAVSESDVLATTHSVFANTGDLALAADRIATVCAGVECERFVLGFPRRSHRHEGNDSRFERFAEVLRQRTCKEVILWDEALTSVAAEKNLELRGVSRRDARGLVDMEAARLILQSWLDETTGRQP